jgi:hypothetical protein
MKLEINNNQNLQSIFFRLKIPFVSKSFQFKFSLYATPETWVYGYSSRCKDGKYVLFHDYDDLSKNDVIEELKTLQSRFHLSDYYLFKLGKKSFHAVCLDKFSLSDAFEIQKQTSCDSAFIRAPLCLGMREWVLRIGKKGERSEPKFIKKIRSDYRERTLSRAHAKFMEKYFGVNAHQAPFANFDQYSKLTIVKYTTASRVKND